MERYTNPDCKPEMEELMKDCPRSRSGAECWLRLCDIEDILGDEYDLDELRELVQAKREGRCVVMPCDPGQVVWAANSFGVSSHQIRMLVRDKDGDFACSMIKFPLEDFGRKVFLTRAEAEAALRREQE